MLITVGAKRRWAVLILSKRAGSVQVFFCCVADGGGAGGGGGCGCGGRGPGLPPPRPPPSTQKPSGQRSFMSSLPRSFHSVSCASIRLSAQCDEHCARACRSEEHTSEL